MTKKYVATQRQKQLLLPLMEQFEFGSQDMGKQEWAETFNIQFICNSVVDPEWFFSAPDQTLKGVLSQDPAWIFLLSVNLPLSRELHVKIALYSWSYNDK